MGHFKCDTLSLRQNQQGDVLMKSLYLTKYLCPSIIKHNITRLKLEILMTKNGFDEFCKIAQTLKLEGLSFEKILSCKTYNVQNLFKSLEGISLNTLKIVVGGFKSEDAKAFDCFLQASGKHLRALHFGSVENKTSRSKKEFKKKMNIVARSIEKNATNLGHLTLKPYTSLYLPLFEH
eukprot:UN23512